MTRCAIHLPRSPTEISYRDLTDPFITHSTPFADPPPHAHVHTQPLLKPVLVAIGNASSGVHLPSQLCRLAECMLMLQLEAPQTLGLGLPQDLCMRCQFAWQQTYTKVQTAEAMTQELKEVSSALEGLQIPHASRVFNTYPIDALISHEVTNGTTFALLLHPPSHYTSSRNLLGSRQLKARLLQALGCVVVPIRHDEWNEHRTEQQRHSALREMLSKHVPAGQMPQLMPGGVNGALTAAAKIDVKEDVAMKPEAVHDHAALQQAQQRSQSQVGAALAQLRAQQQQQQQPAAKAEGQDGNGSDPRGGDPRGGDPRGSDPRGGDPRGGDPRGGDPRGGDPRGGDPRGGDPRGGGGGFDPRQAPPPPPPPQQQQQMSEQMQMQQMQMLQMQQQQQMQMQQMQQMQQGMPQGQQPGWQQAGGYPGMWQQQQHQGGGGQ